MAGHDARVTLEELLDAHPDALVAAADDDGLFVEMPASVPIAGHRVPAVRSALDLVQPADRRLVIDAWVEAKASGSASTSVALAGSGAPGVVHLLDVTEAHGVYISIVAPGEEVEATSQGLDQLAELPPPPPRVAYSRKDELATIIHIDPAVTEMLGWTAEDMVGERSLGFVHPEDQDRAIDIWMECLSRPGATCRIRLRHRHRDGHWVWLELSNTNLLDQPGAGYVDCEMFDISEEMEAHEAVRASEQLLRRLAESLPVGVARFGPGCQILYANGRLYEILGAEPGAPSEELRTAVVDTAVLEAAMTAVLSGGFDTDVALRIQRLDGGGRRECTLSVRALTNDDGDVVGGVFVLADVTEEALLRSELERRATFDSLTGCINRQTAINRLTEVLAAGDAGRPASTAVIFVDLDGFKAVNDVHGHAAGDAVLTTIAARLRSVVRAPDVVGRLGGDEFLVVCPEVDGHDTAVAVAGRVAAAIAEPVPVGDQAFELTASVGVAWTGAHPGIDADGLIAEADAAMYAAKREPDGNRVVVAPVAAERLSAGSSGCSG